MGYIIKKGTGGGGGGDATAANQLIQIAQDSLEATQQLILKAFQSSNNTFVEVCSGGNSALYKNNLLVIVSNYLGGGYTIVSHTVTIDALGNFEGFIIFSK